MELVSYMYHFTSATASNMSVWIIFLHIYIDLSHCCCVCKDGGKVVECWQVPGSGQAQGTGGRKYGNAREDPSRRIPIGPAPSVNHSYS